LKIKTINFFVCQIGLFRKIVIMILLISVSVYLQGTNYYFAAIGDDILNSGVVKSSPWRSIQKLNDTMSGLQPGDSVFFRRGDVFNGEIRIRAKGTSGSNIFFGAYGSGSKPVINGLSGITDWKKVGLNIWEALCSTSYDQVNNLFINGKLQQIGRWPNKTAPNQGYLSMKWSSGSTRLSSKAIPDAEVWKGADLMVRTNRWVIDWSPILSTKGDTMTIPPTSYDIDREFGFFVCNHPGTLDQKGEWCFNKDTKKITLYSEKDPATLVIEVPIAGELISIKKQQFVTIEDLVLKGALKNAVLGDSCRNITIRNTEIVSSAKNGITFKTCINTLFEKNKIVDAVNNGLAFFDCRGSVIRGNEIRNVGLNPAVGSSESTTFIGLGISGSSNLIEYNRIDSVGYIGLRFDGDSTIVSHNVISNYCIIKDDGGGIYTWNGDLPPNVSRKIIGNIVSNAIGAGFGTNDSLSNSAEGIYIDGGSHDVEVIGNTVFNCSNIGLFINNASKIVALNNLVFNCKTELQMRAEGMPLMTNRQNVVRKNTFVSRTSSQRIGNFITDEEMDGIRRMGIVDSNCYSRPADPDMIMSCSYKSAGHDFHNTHSLKEWQNQYGYDLHSSSGPVRYPYLINKTGAPRKITWGYYNNGRDVWYDEGTISKNEFGKVVKNLTGTTPGSANGMNKFLILALTIDFRRDIPKKYLLRFETKGKPGEMIKANFKTRDNQIVCSREFHLTPSYQKNELLYIPAFANIPFERVNFEFSDPISPVQIRNISFQEADITNNDPTYNFQLLVNDSGVSRVIPVRNGYVDISGNAMGNWVELKPYSSVLLFTKESVSHYEEDRHDRLN